jgi:hypothetical protein
MSTHFRMTDLLANPTRIDTALKQGDTFHLTVAEALLFQKQLTGAVWSAQTIRLTTDLAQIIAKGGQIVVPSTTLATFGASLAFNRNSGLGAVTGGTSATVIAMVVAAAAVIGFAIGHLGRADENATLLVRTVGDAITLTVPVVGA